MSDVGMAQALDNIAGMLDELERDFPELALHRLRDSGMSGKALRVVYQDVADKVVEVRGNYDAALVRAQQMAVSIGGERGLFQGFNLKSYEAGDEDHRIGDRPVLMEAQDWQQIQVAIAAGMPPGAKLWSKIGLGFTDTELEEMEEEAVGGTDDELAAGLLKEAQSAYSVGGAR